MPHKYIPGTKAYDKKKRKEAGRGQITVKEMEKLRRKSKTGGERGQTSSFEWSMEKQRYKGK